MYTKNTNYEFKLIKTSLQVACNNQKMFDYQALVMI